jgi:hypothetical protein
MPRRIANPTDGVALSGVVYGNIKSAYPAIWAAVCMFVCDRYVLKEILTGYKII